MAATDRVLHGLQTSLLVGPVDLPPREELARAFVRIAALGPSTRLGLTLAGEGRWAWHGEAIAARTDEIVRTAPVPGPEAREWLIAHAIPDLPIQLAVSGSHLALVIDHGFCDAYYTFELPGILIDVARGGPIPPLLSGLTAHPLARALGHTWGLRPRRWLALVRAVRTQRRTGDGQVLPALPAAPGVEPGPAITRVSAGRGPVRNVHVTMESSQLTAFREWSAGRVGFSAGLLLLVAAALRAAGLDVAPRGVLVASGRRYLPAGSDTLGNFIVGVNVPLAGPGVEPETVEATLRDGLGVGRPLAALASGVVRSRLSGVRGAGRRRSQVPVPPAAPARPVARVSVSNTGLVRALARLPWLATPGERLVEAVGDAADPAGIGVITCILDGRMHIVISFRDDGFDTEVVQRCAALLATRPVELLTAVHGVATHRESAA